MKPLLSALLVICALFKITAQPTVYNSNNVLNYPVVSVEADYNALPKGWYYTVCSVAQNGSAGTYNANAPQNDQVLYILDDSLRPAYSHSMGPWGMLWNGYVAFWRGKDSILGYNSNKYYFVSNLPQARGSFPRFKADMNRKGFVVLDTLYGTGTAKHPQPTLDPHGIYQGDSCYVIMQDYVFANDTGFGLAMMRYDGSVVALYNNHDPINGIPDSQSYIPSCPVYQIPQHGDYQHPNFIDGVGDSMFIVSMRHQNEICCFKFDKTANEFQLQWRLRPPHDPFGSFTWLNDTIGFAGQHDCEIVKIDGNVWYVSVYDDAACVVREESRYLLMKLDLNNWTCEVIRSNYLGHNTGFMGGAQAVTTSTDVDSLKSAPVFYTTGGIVNGKFDSIAGMDILGMIDGQGNKIAAIKFQTTKIMAFNQIVQLAYQGRAIHAPLLDQFRPKIKTDCQRDSMTLSLTEYYDNVHWFNGSTAKEITLPRMEAQIEVAVNNWPTIGEWWAYSNGCPAVTTDISDVQNKWFDVYPNPAAQYFNLVGDVNVKTEYQLTDVSGKVVQDGYLQPQPIQQVELTGTASGIYFLSFRLGGQTFTKKIVVQ